jgi:carbon monoxide dehydrogenase subunit G
MELEHSFTVPLPEERTWEVLLDVERVAPCMPGATLDSVDGDVISGRIKVKVGPIAMTYAGTARITERDAAAHVITMEASGKETRGAGTASANVTSTLQGEDGQTHVTVRTTLNVTGRPAQFGRGVMAEVGGKLIGIFADNLAKMLSADQAPQEAAGTVPAETEPAGAEPAESEAAETVSAEALPASEQETARTQPLDVLNLPVRSYNALRREGVNTVGDLASKTAEQLLAIDNIGPASVEEIRQKLADHGLALSESPASGNGRAATSLRSAATNGEGTSPVTPIRRAPAEPAADSDDNAINLIGVAGMPVLKRALPVAAALVAAAVIAVRFRIKRRRSRA